MTINMSSTVDATICSVLIFKKIEKIVVRADYTHMKTCWNYDKPNSSVYNCIKAIEWITILFNCMSFEH